MDPLGNSVTVSEPLLIIQNGYIQRTLAADYYIADKVFQRIPTTKRRGSYYTWDAGDWLRSEAQERAPMTPSEGGGFRTAAGPEFYCRVYAIHTLLDTQTEAELIESGISDPRATKTRWVTRMLLLKRELLFADTYFTDSAWNFTRAGVDAAPTGTEFLRFDEDDSDPIGVFGDAIEDMAAATQLEPNVAIIPRRVKRRLLNNPQIIDRMKAIAPKTGVPVATDALLSEVLEIPTILTPKAYYNAAAEGLTKNMLPIYGNHILLVHRSGVEDVEEPTAGVILPWTGYMDGDAGFDGNTVYEIEDPHTKSVKIEGEMAFDMRVTSADLGFFLSDVISG
jgi:hypothetical protein